MRGIPEFNFPQFHSATQWLREQGYEVFSPAEHDQSNFQGEGGVELEYVKDPITVARQCFLVDMTYICQDAEAVALLPGWHNSKGAKAEVALALAIGLSVYYLHTMPSGEWFLTLAEDL